MLTYYTLVCIYVCCLCVCPQLQHAAINEQLCITCTLLLITSIQSLPILHLQLVHQGAPKQKCTCTFRSMHAQLAVLSNTMLLGLMLPYNCLYQQSNVVWYYNTQITLTIGVHVPHCVLQHLKLHNNMRHCIFTNGTASTIA